MKRYRQTVDEIVDSLRPIESSWKDDHSEAVIRCISAIPQKKKYRRDDLRRILDDDFAAGMTALRLALDLSKDEFMLALRATLGRGGTGITRYRNDRDAFLGALVGLGVVDALVTLASRPVSWRDLLIERLKALRGTAIKGQARGRFLEDRTEHMVRKVFTERGYDVRCRFVGAKGDSTEKTDFAIPSRADARILIEVKAYGATGSKQTDILGDISRMVEEKRNDTHLLLVTDGITWTARLNDLRKLVKMQNTGLIARIYTLSMSDELEKDLRQLKKDHDL